ncbi:MAG: translocation/assembly module TamB domain-containing protein, partial [Comamonadaceae bacterium]|nr:translocation/assembly module TamB domain-containing protein [Comamonadaceae bacterium]
MPEPMPLSVRVPLKRPPATLLATAETTPRSWGRAARARAAGASAAASAALAPASAASVTSAASESLQAKEAVQAVEPPLSAIKKGLDTPYAQASARITPWAAQPVPEAQARFENLDLAPFWPGGPSTRLTGRASLAPPTALGPAGSGTAGWRILVQAANALPGPWDRQRLPLQTLKADAEWHDGAVRVRDLNATLAEGTVQASGYWASQPAALDDVKASAAGSEASAAEAASTGGQWQLQATLQGVNPAQLHTQLAPFPLDGQATVSGSAAADAPIAFDASLQARAEAAASAAPRAGDTAAQALARDLAALRLRDATAQGQWQGRTLRLGAVRVRTADAELNGRAIEARLDERAGQGQLQLSAPGARLTLDARVAEKTGGGQLQADVSDLARTLAWVRKLPGVPADLDVGAVRGRARLKADWQGGWADPTVNAALDVPSAQWQPAAAPAQRAATPPAGKAAAKAAPRTAEKTAAETVAETAANKSAAQVAAQTATPSMGSTAGPTAPAAATPPASGAAALAAGVRPASVAPRRAARGGGSARAPAASAVAPYQLQGVQLRLKGRLAQATLQAQGSVRQGPRSLALNALAEGGRRRAGATLAASAWQGTLRRLELAVADPALQPGGATAPAVTAPWRVALQSPLTLSWTPEAAGGGGAQLNASAGALTLAPPAGVSPAAPARVSWEPLRWQTSSAGAGTLTTRGRVQGVPLAWAGLLSASAPGEPPARVTGDAVFNGEWDVALGATLRLHAVAERASGDVTVSAVDAETGVVSRIRAGIKTARLVLDSQGEAVTARLQWDSEHLGQAEAELRSRLTATRAPGHGGATQWAWPESAPLSGHVRARLPRIAAWSVLAPPGWRIRGALAADVQVAGTRGAPEWRGSVTASDVGLRSVADGIELRNGQLRGRLAGTRFIIDELTLQGRPPAATGQAASAARAGQGGGMLRATGEAGWADGALSARLSATIDKLHASIRPDRRVVLSGNLQASMAGSDAKLDGQLRVDEARIELPDESAPRLGDDVIVRGAGGRVGAGQSGPARASAPAATATAPAGQDGPPLTLAAQLRIDLGDAFHVRGQGI